MRVLARGLRATCSWRGGARCGRWRTCARPPPGSASSPCSSPSPAPPWRPARRWRPTAPSRRQWSARPAVRRASRARARRVLADPGTPGDDDAAALAALGADGLAGGRPRRRAARAGRGDGRRRGRRRPRRGARHPRGHAAARPPLLRHPAAELERARQGEDRAGRRHGRRARGALPRPQHERRLAAALRGPVAALHRALPRQPARRHRRRRAAAGPAAGRRDGPLRRRFPPRSTPSSRPPSPRGRSTPTASPSSAACPARPRPPASPSRSSRCACRRPA